MTIFAYPGTSCSRRHGPQGYADYKHYKPWLRDEFSFRCVYCLCRETWLPDGEAYFGVDHLQPQSQSTNPNPVYDDLVYACNVCNAFKSDLVGVIEEDIQSLAGHLEVQPNGILMACTKQGEMLIDICALNRPELISFRRDMIALFSLLEKRHGEEVDRLRKRYFGYPDDLPDLALLRPPRGNSRFEGVTQSYFELRCRGMLPDFY